MDMFAGIIGFLFVAGYAAIALEHRWNLHKSVTAAALGGILWLCIAFAGGGHHVGEAVEVLGSEIFGLVVFLLAAMTLVEILAHYRFFDLIRVKLLSLRLADKAQLWMIGIISFFLSAVIDNLTTTIVMVQIARRFFRGGNLLIATAGIVIAANAGGAFSPIGDITTIMLWLAGKFTAGEIITKGFIPSLVLFFVSTALLVRSIKGDTRDIKEERVVLSRGECVVIGFSLASFMFPLAFSQLGLAPFFGLLAGLGVVGLLIAVLRVIEKHETHLTMEIEKMLARVDLASLLFFTGILLAVGALEHVGILKQVSVYLLGDEPTLMRFVIGNTALGILSALVDNIPLTAAAMSIIATNDPNIWVLLAIAVGTGGSMISIGSAAGVVATGMVKELTFFTYLRIATIPAAIGYFIAIAVWYVQTLIMH